MLSTDAALTPFPIKHGASLLHEHLVIPATLPGKQAIIVVVVKQNNAECLVL